MRQQRGFIGKWALKRCPTMPSTKRKDPERERGYHAENKSSSDEVRESHGPIILIPLIYILPLIFGLSGCFGGNATTESAKQNASTLKRGRSTLGSVTGSKSRLSMSTLNLSPSRLTPTGPPTTPTFPPFPRPTAGATHARRLAPTGLSPGPLVRSTRQKLTRDARLREHRQRLPQRQPRAGSHLGRARPRVQGDAQRHRRWGRMGKPHRLHWLL